LYQPQPPLHTPKKKSQPKKKIVGVSDAEKRLILISVLVVALSSLGMVWRFASINDLQTRVNQLQKQVTLLEKENATLTIEQRRLSSPRQIETRANAELGMQWPAQEQIVNVLGVAPGH